MKFMIAGLGSIGRRHLRNLVALGERDIILYRTHQATLPDEELAGYPVVNNMKEALAHQPQAVIVANPTALHLDIAIPAVMRGAIAPGKPISNSWRNRPSKLFCWKRTGAVGFSSYHPGLSRLPPCSRRRIGRPLSVRAHWGEYLPNWHPWRIIAGYAARSDLWR
jgi:predicted dehydrogenase